MTSKINAEKQRGKGAPVMEIVKADTTTSPKMILLKCQWNNKLKPVHHRLFSFLPHSPPPELRAGTHPFTSSQSVLSPPRPPC